MTESSLHSTDDDSLRSIDDDLLPGETRNGYVFPAYDERCFARVPGTVGATLGVDNWRSLPDDVLPDGEFEHVVVLLIDGFGWDRFQSHRDTLPLLDDLASAGEVSTLTSVYPSETAAAITTMHTGRTPTEHGLLGWSLRFPELDRSCQSLPFLTRPTDDPGFDPDADDTEPRDFGDATDGEVSGRDLFDGTAMYEQLSAEGVECHTVQPEKITGGAYGSLVTAGSTTTAVDSVAEFALSLRRRLDASTGPSYVYAYWPNVDGASHHEGTDSDLYDAELAAVCTAVERELARVDPEIAEETLLLLTADHGHVDTPPANAVDLETYPEIWDRLATHEDGRTVLPSGGPRNLHLHVQSGEVERVRAEIEAAEFEARVLTGEEAIENELFGPGAVSDKLRERIGDLVVVPKDVGVWIGSEERSLSFVGSHGGQHPREMYVPFVATRLSELS